MCRDRLAKGGANGRSEVTMCFRPAEITMNKCPECGAACKPNERVCPKCGADVPFVKIDNAAQQAKFAAEANAAANAATAPKPPAAPGAPAAPKPPR